MQTPDGLQPEGQKRNNEQPIPAKAVPKPEVTITNPLIKAQMPGPKPLSLAAADAVDKWVKAIAPSQNSLQPGMVELYSSVTLEDALKPKEVKADDNAQPRFDFN